MRCPARRRRDLAPAVADHPANEAARAFVVAQVTPDRSEKEPDVLAKRIELVPERLARAQQITADFAVNLEDERRLRLLVGIIGGEKVREQFVVLIYRIDRVAEETRLAAEAPHRPP